MNPPIENDNDTSEEVVGVVPRQDCAEEEECTGESTISEDEELAEESNVPAEDDLQALSADASTIAIILEEGLAKLVSVKILLAGEEVVVPTEDCAKVKTAGEEVVVPTEDCAKVKRKKPSAFSRHLKSGTKKIVRNPSAKRKAPSSTPISSMSSNIKCDVKRSLQRNKNKLRVSKEKLSTVMEENAPHVQFERKHLLTAFSVV